MKRTEEKQGDSLGVATWPQRADSGCGGGEGIVLCTQNLLLFPWIKHYPKSVSPLKFKYLIYPSPPRLQLPGTINRFAISDAKSMTVSDCLGRVQPFIHQTFGKNSHIHPFNRYALVPSVCQAPGQVPRGNCSRHKLPEDRDLSAPCPQVSARALHTVGDQATVLIN